MLSVMRHRWIGSLLLAGLFGMPASAFAQSPPFPPPNFWHPFRGGTNCIQVADASGNFNCAGGTTVDPTTGNLVVAGSLSFQSAAVALNGLVVAPSGTTLKTWAGGDFVIATSPRTAAPAGPGRGGAAFRIRSIAGRCQIVVAGGDGFGEFVVPVLDALGQVQTTFPGGYSGC